jgi:phage terminase large subunit
MSRPVRQAGRLPEVVLPYRFVPRSYQLPAWRALEQGCKRAVLIWHRKAGKDLFALNWTITQMLTRPGLYWHLFPDGVEARRAVWDGISTDGRAFLDYFPKDIVLEQNETEMSIRTVSAQGGTSVYQLAGVDNADRLRGPNPVGAIFSEHPYQNPQAWEIVAPILAANGGWAVFPYTPAGRNHGFDLYRQACADPSWFTEILTIEQTHKDAPGEDGSAVVTPEVLAAERRRGVDEDFIQQEYYCSFEGTRSGSYYGDALRRAREQGRITRVPWDPTMAVECWADLGLGDHLAYWFTQSVGPRIHVIRFWQGTGSDSIVELAKVLKELPYVYSTHLWPHDADGIEQGTGKTRREMAEALGIRPIDVQRKAAVSDGITAARALLERCYFDEVACRQGLDALGFYHRDWDPKRQTWKDDPPHDWSSHAADAFRTGAMGTRGGVPLVAQDLVVESSFALGGRRFGY